MSLYIVLLRIVSDSTAIPEKWSIYTPKSCLHQKLHAYVNTPHSLFTLALWSVLKLASNLLIFVTLSSLSAADLSPCKNSVSLLCVYKLRFRRKKELRIRYSPLFFPPTSLGGLIYDSYILIIGTGRECLQHLKDMLQSGSVLLPVSVVFARLVLQTAWPVMDNITLIYPSTTVIVASGTCVFRIKYWVT